MAELWHEITMKGAKVMEIQRKAQVLLEVAAAAKSVPNASEFTRRLGKAALALDDPEGSERLAKGLRLVYDVDTGQLTNDVPDPSPGDKAAVNEIAHKLGNDAPAIFALRERLPQLTWGMRHDDVVLLNEEEARVLRWVGLAAGQDVK